MATAGSAKQQAALLFCLVLFPVLLPSSSAQNCNLTVSNREFKRCSALPQLDSTLHWTYDAQESTVDVAYRARPTAGSWIAWALNPNRSGMIGAQTLVARRLANGTMKSWTTSVVSFGPDMREASLSFAVNDLSAEYEGTGGFMTIFATIGLWDGSTSVVNHVWQQSTDFGSDGYPSGHSDGSYSSFGSLDLASGDSSSATGIPRQRRKNVHGVLNAVSWGVLMPLGAIIARYMRVFQSADPAWFYLHVACQCSAYVVGVAGWGTGLKLGSDSKGVTHDVHRNIGITLFCLATLQVFALLLRPQKDHKYRVFWNVYHHFVGYAVIVLSIFNVFEGFDILDPEKKWKNAYIGVLIALGAVALILEVATWVVVLARRSRSKPDRSHGVGNGHNI